MMNGKITRSFSGNTGRTSGILIASSFAVSFASVMSHSPRGTVLLAAMGVPVVSWQLRASFQSVQLFHKSVDVFESAVDRGKADVGDGIEAAQAVHDHRAEGLRRDLAFRGVGHCRLDRVRHPLEL